MSTAQRSALVVSRLLRNHFRASGGRPKIAGGHAKRGGKIVAVPPPQRKKVTNGEECVDVFISHRGVDTKRTVAGLLYDRLVHAGLRPFLDSQTTGPGARILERVDAGVRQSKVGIAVLSRGYCDSVFCLRELAMLVDSGKKLIPVFYDVKPSELKVGCRPLDVPVQPEELERFDRALQEARYTVGLTFDSKNGNWSDLLSTTVDSVLRCMREERRR